MLSHSHDLFTGFAAVLGLLLGSFANVCIARMPEDRSIVWPGSQCPACGKPIRPYDNIPLLSWALLRGKCRDCKTPISPIYPAVELLMAALAFLLFRRIIPNGDDLDVAHLAAFVVALLFTFMLVAQAFIDVRHYIIPDQFSIYAVPLGIVSAVLLTHLHAPNALTWRQSVIGALLGGGILAFIMGVYWLIRRREGMGMGDVKLLAMIGAFLGFWPAIPFVVFFASIAGTAVGIPMAIMQRKGFGTALPFGPFLALGAITYLLHGAEWTSRLFPGFQLLFSGT